VARRLRLGGSSSSQPRASRRLSAMQGGPSGDFFPSPYSIKDQKVLELMRKVNMDLFDEELHVSVKPSKWFEPDVTAAALFRTCGLT
jgi:hypothetical protein